MSTISSFQPTSPFEILRRKRGILNYSAMFASNYLLANGGGLSVTGQPNNGSATVGTETAARGIAMGSEADNQVDLAGPNNFAGHLTRRVVVGGLSLADRVFGVTNPTPVGLESPFTDGLEVSMEKAEEIECEGPVYLATGVNAITTNTPVGTGLTFQNGQLRIANESASPPEQVYYTLSVNNLTPITAGALRIRAISAAA